MTDIKPRVWKFKQDREVHVVLRFGPKRPRSRDRFVRFVCGPKVEGSTRLAPHSNPAREPEITCGTCLDAVTACNDVFDGLEV